MIRAHLSNALLGCIVGLLIASVAVAEAASPKGEKDDRDVVQEALLFHIMLRDRDSAEVAQKKLSQVPPDVLLSQFKTLAKSESLDRASAPTGGYLGTVREGEFDKEFEAAVFSQPINTVSPPIKSSFGWHLVYLTEKSEKAVLEICRESLATALAKSKPRDRDPLQVSAKNDTLMHLQPDITQILGDDWSKPFVDWNENLAFFKKLPRSPASSRVQLLVHTEYLHPRYSASPLACKRSLQELFDIDCSTERVNLRKSQEFEGRGAIGKTLREVKLPKNLPPISAGPNGYYRQLVTQACAK